MREHGCGSGRGRELVDKVLWVTKEAGVGHGKEGGHELSVQRLLTWGSSVWGTWSQEGQEQSVL
jgi:hypothetical protein